MAHGTNREGAVVVVELDEVVTCGPAIQQMVQGSDDERAFGVAREAMRSFPVL